MRTGAGFWRQSILVRLGIAMGLIAVLALASIMSSAVFTEMSQGKAGAINLSGSLRMQSYLIASTVAGERGPDAAPSERLARQVDRFDAKLLDPGLIIALPADPAAPVRAAYDRVSREWREQVRPAALAAGGPRDPAAFVARVEAFVGHIDTLVKRLEDDLEGKIQALRLFQGVALLLIVAVIFVTMYLMHTQVAVPLADLLAASRAVRGGDFGVRAANTGEDELGQLGLAFNFMVQDLSRMYANLEARVAEKTAELERTNRSLELLYRTTRTLTERELGQETLETVMRDMERVVGVAAVGICAYEPARRQGFPLTLTRGDGPGTPSPCGTISCEACFAAGELRECTRGPEGTVVSVPLTDGERVHGVMPLAVPAGERLEAWQLRLAEAVGRHVGTALGADRQREERHRLALLEERSVIARELHDSLAQSLSYLKIQVARLQAELGGDAREGSAAAGILDELKTGLANAYRQLRELLTTFRLRMDGQGLGQALEETVAEFTRRTGLEIRLANRLAGIALGASEEIHVLQVVREALSNVEHHAGARHVDIALERHAGNRVRVRVDDDGRGIGEAAARTHHYGLAIMRDRAASLGGELHAASRPEGGTRVELDFLPANPFAAPTPAPATP